MIEMYVVVEVEIEMGEKIEIRISREETKT